MSDMEQQFSTPMMQQYIQIKQKYVDCILFFRLGDFYELFLEDALVGARVLGITLTKRPRGKDGDIPMAGVPYHAAHTYITKLIKSGYKIAICEQISPPNTKGIVERAVVRIITPGTVLDDASLPQKQHNFILSVAVSKKKFGIAVADVSTGHFSVTELPRLVDEKEVLQREVLRFNPQECIVSNSAYSDGTLLRYLTSDTGCFVAAYSGWQSTASKNKKKLEETFGLAALHTIGIAELLLAVEAAANLLRYLEHTQQQSISHLSLPELYHPEETLQLDPSTITNLELTQTIRTGQKQGSLLGLLDHTVTAAGGRLLQRWLSAPLHSITEINRRLDAVEELVQSQLTRSEIRNLLSNVYDIERQLAKLSLHLATPASIINIAQSLQIFLRLQKTISTMQSQLWKDIGHIPASQTKQVLSLIEDHLEESTEHGSTVYIIKKGINRELDTLREIKSGADTWLQQFEESEKKATGISSLKCKFNSVFGFYIEVSNANLHSVPAHYQRKQTLVNAERFITPELKKHEELVLSAQEKIVQLEQEIFSSLVKKIVTDAELLKKIAFELAQLDVITTFAHVAQSFNYSKPSLVSEGELHITNGRHPVVESIIGERFVPNSIHLNDSDHQLVLITGPNMAGKSVAMRQVAIITLMAHLGCFVPATHAQIPITDNIFVRSGASDSISDGLSTFMVEMVEASYILRHATKNSLVIMDEIGRGTSTYDGISIAWAIAEFLITKKDPPKVLFATHYHELQTLADNFADKVKNYRVAVERHNGKPLFLYTLMPGKSSHSFGISVAELAGVPQMVIHRAEELLTELEKRNGSPRQSETLSQLPISNSAESKLLNQLRTELAQLDLNTYTPLQAFETLVQLQQKYTNDKNK